MGAGGRSIQHELRRQAAQVAIPTDMWEKISGRLHVKRVRTQRRQSCGSGPEPQLVTEGIQPEAQPSSADPRPTPHSRTLAGY